MRGSPSRSRAFAIAVALLLPLGASLGGCKRSPPPAPTPPPGPATSASGGRPLAWEPTARGFGIAIPPGCHERAPSLRAVLEGRSVYFVAGDEPADGIVLIDRLPGPAAGWSPFRDAWRAAPLFDVEAPQIAYDGKRFRGLYAVGPSDARSVVVTRAGDPSHRLLATGDALSVTDFRCREGRCVALLPRIGKVASPGVSLLSGGAGDDPWTRRDVDLDEGEKPLGISALGASRRTAFATIVGAGEEVQIREVDDATLKAHAPLSLPFGTLDTALLPGDRAAAIGHGARVVGDCAEPKPAATVAREGLPSITWPIAAPMLHAMLRPLGTGAIAVYSAALRCREDRHRFVTAQLLDEAGAPRGPSMAIAEARGFAISTRGDEIDFVILREKEIVVAQARCPSDAAAPAR